MTTEQPYPTQLKLLQKEHLLKIEFSDGFKTSLTCGFLRAHSPSAENRKQSEEEYLTLLNSSINIVGIDPIGNYAVRLVFDDGHQTGIYSWPFLYDLALKSNKQK